ncbi:MAG TPA: hypothetical protein VMW10_01615 [Alphaproteobacteria bacterium]|nr:hypothetical protein [Alphaproteobacteria bacterium]
MHKTKSLKDLAYNVLKKNKGEAKLKQRIALTLQHQNQNVKSKPEARADNTDKPHGKGDLSVLSVTSGRSFGKSSLLDDFEERLAIAEYDGDQSSSQARRIAYQDAFIAVLNTLPYDEAEGYYDEDWLTRRAKAARNWLLAQGVQQPK